MKKIDIDSVSMLHEYGVHLPSRTIYIGSESVDLDGDESGTDAKMAEKVVKNLLILESINQEPITIIMNNLGGNAFHGIAIYDAIRACKSKVIIKAIGHVMSMGSIILQAGDTRILYKHVVMLIHYGEDGYNTNHPKNIRNWVSFTARYDKKVHKIYLDKIREKFPDFSVKKLNKLLDFDTLLMPEEALQLGLADEIEE